MNEITVVGIDPGLVHTGCVSLTLNGEDKWFETDFELVDGMSIPEIRSWVTDAPNDAVFIENYRSWSGYSTNTPLIDGVQQIHRALPGSTLLYNGGVDTVVQPDLLKLLGLWVFPRRSHHNDLRSAAKIMLLGLMKNKEWNKLLAACVQAHIDGQPWVDRGGAP